MSRNFYLFCICLNLSFILSMWLKAASGSASDEGAASQSSRKVLSCQASRLSGTVTKMHGRNGFSFFCSNFPSLKTHEKTRVTTVWPHHMTLYKVKVGFHMQHTWCHNIVRLLTLHTPQLLINSVKILDQNKLSIMNFSLHKFFMSQIT